MTMDEQYMMYGIFDRATEQRVGRLFSEQSDANIRAYSKNRDFDWDRYEVRPVQVADVL
jgi:hypothetical protein